jgi:DNA-binding IclR family transcriptional regulator
MTKMTPNVGEDILDVVNKTPGIRTQMISMQVGVTHSTVWRML